METMRLAVRQNHHYVYPDVMVSCHPDDQRAEQQYQYPVLLVEVLSPSTEAYDRGAKFNQYKQLSSLRHYLLVSQQIWLVEWFRKNEHGGWDYTVLAEAHDALAIPELGVTLTLAEVYAETGIVPMRVSPALESGLANEPDASRDKEQL
ncbi:MAG: Uma2 family endonuclease [Hymenobacter sp.]